MSVPFFFFPNLFNLAKKNVEEKTKRSQLHSRTVEQGDVKDHPVLRESWQTGDRWEGKLLRLLVGEGRGGRRRKDIGHRQAC